MKKIHSDRLIPSFQYIKVGFTYQFWGNKDKNMLKSKMQRKYGKQ
jgi:hypothetical protein